MASTNALVFLISNVHEWQRFLPDVTQEGVDDGIDSFGADAEHYHDLQNSNNFMKNV